MNGNPMQIPDVPQLQDVDSQDRSIWGGVKDAAWSLTPFAMAERARDFVLSSDPAKSALANAAVGALGLVFIVLAIWVPLTRSKVVREVAGVK